MYRRKQDIDKHVESLRSKLSLKEFNVRACSLARLYYNVGDYASCQKYIEQYISSKGNDAASHMLLGQTLQKLGRKDKAVEEFQTALNIDPSQTSLILEICELLADKEVNVDPGKAKYWYDKAEVVFPKHPITFRLRECLGSSGNSNPNATITHLKNELVSYPNDVTVHILLLKQYLAHNLYLEAFKHSFKVEFNSVTIKSLHWYKTLYDVLEKQCGNNINSWQYNLLLLTVHECFCLLSLIEIPRSSENISDIQLYLHQYDQAIEKVGKAGAPPGFAEFHTALLHHHHGQFVFHIATYLLKIAKQGKLSWREATNHAAPLMLLSWHTKPMFNNIHWLEKAPETQRTSVRRWNLEGSFRCSQSGHYLLQNVQEKSDKFLDMVSQYISHENWKDKLYDKIFTNSSGYPDSVKLTSHMLNKSFEEPPLRLPTISEVREFDLVAQQFNPSSLHHIVWILMNYKTPSDFKCTLFEMLSTTPRNYPNCGPETLNKLDIIAFLHCATFTVLQVASQSVSEKDRPRRLPANISDMLCSLPQMKWWECAYKFSQNELGVDLSDVRRTLSQGIEVIRCFDKHGLDPDLLCKLGSIFYEYSRICIDPIEISSYEQRAALYYSNAIPLLDKCKKNISISSKTDHRLFNYTQKDLTRNLGSLLEESKLFMGRYLYNQSDYEKAVQMLTDIKSPKAYFYLCQIYKKLAMDEYKNNSTSDMKMKYGLLLNNAKKYAYKSLNTVKDSFEDGNDLYIEIQSIIEDIETKLRKLDIDVNNDTNPDNYSDLNITPTGSEHNLLQSTIYHNSTPKHTLDNRTHYKSAIESQLLDNARTDQRYFEKIDHQIRILQKWDATVNNFMEQTKNWIDENRNVGNRILSSINNNYQNTIDQFKQLSLSVDQVKDQIGDCRNECKDVAELKKDVEALKKEIYNLKKVPSQASVDKKDLYDSASFTSGLPSANNQVIPPINPRLMPPFPFPPTPYHLYSQNLYNLFSSHFAQPPSVPGTAPVFDPSRPPVNFPGLYPQHDQMYADLAHLLPPGALPATPSVASISSTVTTPVISASTSKHQQTPTFNKERKLPVNVVITSSDPLPPVLTTPAQVLSVTIPPEHIKQTVHNYQIPLPHNEVTSTPTIFPTWPQSTTTNIPKDNSNANFMFGSPKKSELFNVSDALELSGASEIATPNKSRTLSEKSNTSVENYDPYFKPIISLPDEVPVVTGEEDETPIFKSRAKLYRFVEKEWKERGLGEIKLLKHQITGRVRVLMRRDQVFNICANHLITPEMKIQPMNKENNAYIWCAHDFAEESVVLEKFCIRFKTSEIGKSFYESFEKARKESELLKDTSPTKALSIKVEPKPESISKEITSETKSETQSKTVIGGFTFSSTPTFKTVKDPEEETIENCTEKNKTNLFSNFTFNMSNSTPYKGLFTSTTESSNSKAPETKKDDSTSKLNISTSSDVVEEYEPNVEFKPVVPLPALVDQKTGEEDEIVLFEHRAKLLRFDVEAKEWKERGLGNIKILVQEKNPEKIRLLMRREQVMKVCCNHALTKDITFQKMPNTDKAVSWCAKDYSEGELIPETFCLRFKTAQILDEFLAAVKIAQIQIASNSIITKEVKSVKENSQVGFGDKFKPKAGSWYCETCYTNNLDNFLKCACCGQSKPAPNILASDKQKTSTTEATSWGDQFKPKPGSWECKECYVQNTKDTEICTVCSSPMNPTAVINKATTVVEENTTKFAFGIPSSQTLTKAVSWGDQFKPKANSWECSQCFVRNEENVEQCVACNSHKDPSKKVETKSILETAPVSKFHFGIPQKQGATEIKNNSTSIFDGSGSHQFTFGVSAESNNKLNTSTGFTFGSNTSSQPLNFSLNKLQENQPKPSLLPTPDKNTPQSISGTTGKFEFGINPEIKANTVKSPKSDKEGDSDGNEYASEDDGDHLWFKPVISLPDKVEVVTGEENEAEVFTHRAKLYIYVSETREWKERGLGNVKILVHKETAKHRVLMRREQVHKICLNFALTPDVKFTKKDEKSWIFAVNDFSEGELQFQQFCLRFSNKEIATNFSDNIDKIQKSKESLPAKDGGDDVIFVKEVQANPEQKKKAKDLLLPENFFVTRDEKPCMGCRGCEDNDDKDKAKTTTQSNISSTITSKPSDSIFKTPLNPIGQNTKTSNNANKLLTSLEPDDKENKSVKSNIFIQKPSEDNSDVTLASMLEKDTSVIKPFIRAPKLNVANTETVNSKPNDEKIQEKPMNVFETSNLKFGNVFGFSTKTSENEKPPFGSNSPLFGNATSTQPLTGSIFGNGQLFSSKQPLVEFGSLTQKVTDTKENNMTNNKTDVDKNAKVEGGIFGNKMLSSQQPTTGFGALAQNAAQSNSNVPFKVDETLSFSALSSNNAEFNIKKQENFKWEGMGQQIFTSDASKNVSKQSNDADTTEEYDPHYEPIVPLPEEIVVSTGEENEVKLFGERAKLYRLYTDNGREWKERGVGEVKILHDPTKNTYRLLLRREQVHKAVLNTLLYHDTELLPMNLSPNAWTWACHNFAEVPEGVQETLALRFKNAKLANSFKDKVVECTRKLQAAAAQAIRDKEEQESSSSHVSLLRLPKSIKETARVDHALTEQALQMASVPQVSHTEEDHSNEADESNEYEDYENYDEEAEEEEYFVSIAKVVIGTDGGGISTWPEVHIQVLYSQTQNAPKVFITDITTGEILTDMILHSHMTIKIDENTCSWSGVDYITQELDKEITVFFPDAEKAMEFYDACETCKAMSCQGDVVEDDEEEEEEEE